MKKLKALLPALIILLSMFAFVSCEEGNIFHPKSPFDAFYSELGSGGQDRAVTASRRYNDILTVSDGWVAVGNLYGEPLDAVIAKYDKGGNILWERAFGGSGLEEFRSITEVSDGYIVTARCASVDGDLEGLDKDKEGFPNSIIIKYNKRGKKVWAKELPAHTVTANKYGFLAAYSGGRSSKIIHIVQYNLRGDILWSESVGGKLTLYGNTNDIVISKILKAPNGYFLYGVTRDVGPFGDSSEGPSFMALMSEEGKICWQKKISMHDLKDVVVSADGVIAVGADYIGGESFSRVPYIKKFDFDMNLIWETPYGEGKYWLNFIKATVAGENVFVTGVTQNKAEKTLAIGINRFGEIFWEDLSKEDKDSVIYYNVFSVGEKLVVYRHSYNYGKNSIVENTFLFYDLDSMTQK